MNANTLRKHYDKLTARERFAAIVAARGRRDNSEIDALLTAAKKTQWSVPDTFGIAQAFTVFMMYHTIKQSQVFGAVFFIMFTYDEGDAERAKNLGSG